jgi:group I intron endonuclease
LTKIILQVCDSYEENIEAERYWCNDVFNASKNPMFYNFAEGGSGGRLIAGFSDEEKKKVYEKIGLSSRGRKFTKEWKEKISKGGIGLKRNDETKKRISKAKQGKANSFYGKTHTDDALQKISNRSKGRNNPRATMIEVIGKNNEVIFEGIRKEVVEWCKENGICSESNLKNHLYSGKAFNPKYVMTAYPNSKDYVGIRFVYKQ